MNINVVYICSKRIRKYINYFGVVISRGELQGTERARWERPKFQSALVYPPSFAGIASQCYPHFQEQQLNRLFRTLVGKRALGQGAMPTRNGESRPSSFAARDRRIYSRFLPIEQTPCHGTLLAGLEYSLSLRALNDRVHPAEASRRKECVCLCSSAEGRTKDEWCSQTWEVKMLPRISAECSAHRLMGPAFVVYPVYIIVLKISCLLQEELHPLTG